MTFSTAWAMPSRWTFTIPPINDFVKRWVDNANVIVDPFSGRSTFATLSNDLATGGVDAGEWCQSLLPEYRGKADVVIFDPPYSPRQISECYKSIGLPVTSADTRNASLYKRVRQPLSDICKPGGIALSFGWQSSGFGKKWLTREILLVQHGGAHNDTICVAQEKIFD